MAALNAVAAGSLASETESETVDFKEETGTRDKQGQRVTVPSRHEPAAVALAAEVGCLANSEDGGVLVVGVDDAGGGLPALTGAYLDADWLRRRIHALTHPSYTVDVEEITFQGARILLIDVPPALEEIRSGGRLRVRVGTACEELTGDRARQFLERRRAYDWTSEPSGAHFQDADPAALASARIKYQATKGQAPPSDLELCRRLGLLRNDGDPDNPEFNNAGALLLTAQSADAEQLTVLVTQAEGLTSTDNLRGTAPLLLVFDQAWDLLTSKGFPANTAVIGPTRRLLRTIPDVAIREALVNAIMHRDYRYPRRSINVQAIAGKILKVRSPGGFVAGVNPDRLITSPSIARNPILANALRALGLAEGEGVGVDTMYSLMLRDGHPEPVIEEDAGDIIVTLNGGAPDTKIASFFEGLATRGPSLTDVRTAIAVTALRDTRVLRAETLAARAQCSVADATTTLNELAAAGVVERLVNRSLAFRLTTTSLTALGDRVRYPAYRALDQHWDLVRAYLDDNPEISRDDATTLLGVAPNYASRILSQLADGNHIVPVANARGPRVRYRLP